MLDGSLVRVKVWNRQGKILYSDEPRLIGEPYGLAADERRSLDVGVIEAEVSDLAKPENRFEQSFGKLLEVYLPIQTPSGKPLLFEAYYDYSLVCAQRESVVPQLCPDLVGCVVDARARADPDRLVARAAVADASP